MYHSKSLIEEMQAEKLMALQLEKALSGVKDEFLKQVSGIGDGATRLLYYTSCFTDNYQDVCAKLKKEDIRFLEGIQQLIKGNNIISDMVQLYVESLLDGRSQQQIEDINRILYSANIYIAASSLSGQSFAIGITIAICLGSNISISLLSKIVKVSGIGLTGLGFYGYVKTAADSAERLKRLNPDYYHRLYLQKLEMMYFLIENTLMKNSNFSKLYLSDREVANIIIDMVNL